MKFCRLQRINQRMEENAGGFIARAEQRYSDRIRQVAEYLAACCEEKPVVLLSGPSGSGKTTTALRIESLLDSWGHETHTLSMDNYFLPSGTGVMPLDENGNPDFENPQRLDIPLLEEHLQRIFRCEPVEVPIFDFKTQSRPGSIPLHRKPGELVILEGIHALNPAVTGRSDDSMTGIYVSVRTRITGERGQALHPAKIRLMRRLIRDKLFRGREAEETIRMFQSVSRGEQLYIMPYKYRAHIDIDTFMAYEPAVYRDLLLPGLRALDPEFLQQMGESDLPPFLEAMRPDDASLVPEDSLIREFIGGSIYHH
jgi:uridine kinase